MEGVKNSYKCITLLIAALLLSLPLCVEADLNHNQIPDNTWYFLFAPYGWFTSVSGDITTHNVTKHLHIPFRDILRDVKFAGEAHLEASYNRWSFMIDPTYIKLSQDIDKRILKTTLNTDMTLVDAGVFYRLLSSPPSQPQFASFELLGGARYLQLGNDVEFDRRPELNVSQNESFCAPIIGGRIKFYPTQKTELWLRGDGGGFNVDNMRSTWSGTIGFAYSIHSHVDLGVAYRILDIDFREKNLTANVLMYGPMVGIAFYS